MVLFPRVAKLPEALSVTRNDLEANPIMHYTPRGIQ